MIFLEGGYEGGGERSMRDLKETGLFGRQG